MQPATLRPTAIRIDKPRKLLVIPWNDGVTSEYNWQALRDACPCAGCRTPEAAPVPDPLPLVFKLKPAKVALLDGAEVVGNYAVRLLWTDGHKTGIYPWEYLRGLAPA